MLFVYLYTIPLLAIFNLIRKTPGVKWQTITRKYFGDAWVRNELAVMNTIIKQQKMLPISVEQARGSSSAAKEPEPVSREERAQYSEEVRPIEERALKQWAIENQLWVTEIDF